MSERTWDFRIDDMLHAVSRILSKTQDLNYEGFHENEDICDIVLRQFQILGEAARKMPDDVKARYPDIDWRGIIGTRHFVVHEYKTVNYRIIWDVIIEKLPALKEQLRKIRLDLNKSD